MIAQPWCQTCRQVFNFFYSNTNNSSLKQTRIDRFSLYLHISLIVCLLFFLIFCFFSSYYFDFVQKQKNTSIITGLSLIPWFHAYGFITTLAVMAMNIKIVFLIRFDEEQYLETIQNYKVSSMLIPSQMHKTFLISTPNIIVSIKIIIVFIHNIMSFSHAETTEHQLCYNPYLHILFASIIHPFIHLSPLRERRA